MTSLLATLEIGQTGPLGTVPSREFEGNEAWFEHAFRSRMRDGRLSRAQIACLADSALKLSFRDMSSISEAAPGTSSNLLVRAVSYFCIGVYATLSVRSPEFARSQSDKCFEAAAPICAAALRHKIIDQANRVMEFVNALNTLALEKDNWIAKLCFPSRGPGAH